MAMDPRCAAAVRAVAAGRKISDERMQLIEDTLRAKMRELASMDRARWQTLSRDQRVMEAGDAAMAEIHAKADLKEFRAGLQVTKDRKSTRLNSSH